MNGFNDDPFGDKDDMLKKVKELEQKYGTAYHGGGSSYRGPRQKQNDRAVGYDESDDFIDNGEAVAFTFPVLSRKAILTEHFDSTTNTFRMNSTHTAEDFT